ncbi:MAG: polysaccharide deacetylase [Sphingomonadales bacterium]|nr:polysaccharide deacetylase [Sphingomonadales bacterium]
MATREVQFHCHPNWLGAHGDGTVTPGTPFELTCMDKAQQREAIAMARDLLVEAGAPEPVAFRAGSYAADDDTIAVLAERGIRFDSSFNGAEPRDVSAISLPRKQAAPIRTGGVMEVPVGQLRQPSGTLRPLQICAVSSGELRHAIDHAAAHDHPATVIVGHSFELATRDGLRVNDVVRRRFDQLCRDLAARHEEAPTAHFVDLRPRDLVGDANHASVPALRYAHRMAEQLWANWIERRAA